MLFSVNVRLLWLIQSLIDLIFKIIFLYKRKAAKDMWKGVIVYKMGYLLKIICKWD